MTARDGSRAASPRSRVRLVAAVAALVVALDAATKAIAVQMLSERDTVEVLGGAFQLDLYRNFAGPRNTLEGHPVLVSLLALTGVAVFAIVTTRVRSVTAAIAVGLVLGGGIGNLVDRIVRAPGPLRGGVVDWLRPGWASGSMNLADLSIQAAIFLIVLGTAYVWWRGRSRPRGLGSTAPPAS